MAASILAIVPVIMTVRYAVTASSDRSAEKQLMTADRDTDVVTLSGGGTELVSENALNTEVADWIQIGTGTEQTIDIANEGFEKGSAAITQQARHSLGKLVALLKADARLTAQIVYHAEASEASAVGLEQMRAKALVDELAAQGAPRSRVTAVAAGPKQAANVEEKAGLQLVLSKG
jgi:outer membrane protein OmpA-like peptidoglycan-associated protein